MKKLWHKEEGDTQKGKNPHGAVAPIVHPMENCHCSDPLMMVQLNRRARTTGSRADEARNASGLCFFPADRTRLPIEAGEFGISPFYGQIDFGQLTAARARA